MTRHTRAHSALAGDRPESPTCKCFIALTHFQRLKRETEIQTEFTVPSSHQLQASGEARAFLTRESTSRGKQEGEGRAGPPGAAQRPSPLVPHPLPPGEKCSQNNPHSLEATLCPPSFRGGRSLADDSAYSGFRGWAGSALTEQETTDSCSTGHSCPRSQFWACLPGQEPDSGGS